MSYLLKDLNCRYQDRVVLDLPSLLLEPHGHYALVGENGAGKSTLLSILTDRLQTQLPAWQVGYLPQKPYPFSLNVRDSLALGIPHPLGITPREQQNLIEKQLKDYDLLELADKRADRLSGGESQRLAIARLLIVPRQILLLDEPGNHIDRDRLGKILQLLKDYLERHQCLLMMSTHTTPLLNLTQNVLALDQGQLVFSGALDAYLATRQAVLSGETSC